MSTFRNFLGESQENINESQKLIRANLGREVGQSIVDSNGKEENSIKILYVGAVEMLCAVKKGQHIELRQFRARGEITSIFLDKDSAKYILSMF